MDFTEDVKIANAFRQGNASPRQMCVELVDSEDKFKILAKTSMLKGKKNARR